MGFPIKGRQIPHRFQPGFFVPFSYQFRMFFVGFPCWLRFRRFFVDLPVHFLLHWCVPGSRDPVSLLKHSFWASGPCSCAAQVRKALSNMMHNSTYGMLESRKDSMFYVTTDMVQCLWNMIWYGFFALPMALVLWALPPPSSLRTSPWPWARGHEGPRGPRAPWTSPMAQAHSRVTTTTRSTRQ